MSATDETVVLPPVPGAEPAGTARPATLDAREVSAWFGLLGPKGLPDNITGRVADEAAAFVKRPDVADKLRALGVQATSSTPEEFHKLLSTEVVRWLDVAQHASIAGE